MQSTRRSRQANRISSLGYEILKPCLVWYDKLSNFSWHFTGNLASERPTNCISLATDPIPRSNLLLFQQAMQKFKDQKRFEELVDPLLREEYPANGLSQAVAVAALCLQEEAASRPFMADVVTALSVLID